MENVKVSVVIPLYNKEESVFGTIDSVLNQSYSDFELIIVDDGSTDCSKDIATSFVDTRIRYIYKENGGVSSARNVGIKAANSDWILLLDADDYLLEDGLGHLVAGVMKYPAYRVITHNSLRRFGQRENKWRTFDEDRLEAYSSSRFVIRTGTTLFHKSCFDRCGMFDETLSLYEDYKLFLDIVAKFPILQIGCEVFAYDTDFCGLSTVQGLRKTDFLYSLKLTGEKEYDKCLLFFVAMRLGIAKVSNDKEIISFIESNFDVDKAKEIYGKHRAYASSLNRYNKCLRLKELLYALLHGHIELKKSYAKSLALSRFGKIGGKVKIGKHFNSSRASHVFIYDNVSIGRNVNVENTRGRLVIRSGAKVGNNVRICTSEIGSLLNVVIGRNVVIGDNVTLMPGSYVKDNSIIAPDTIVKGERGILP